MGLVSVPVELDALRSRIDEFGPVAYLVTVGDDHRPHVVSVEVRCEADRLVLHAGRRTAANLASAPTLTLLWPSRNGGAYSLIVDAAAAAPPGDNGAFAAVPASAVLHRVAGAPGTGATCLPV
jgi:hypothetical protein